MSFRELVYLVCALIYLSVIPVVYSTGDPSQKSGNGIPLRCVYLEELGSDLDGQDWLDMDNVEQVDCLTCTQHMSRKFVIKMFWCIYYHRRFRPKSFPTGVWAPLKFYMNSGFLWILPFWFQALFTRLLLPEPGKYMICMTSSGAPNLSAERDAGEKQIVPFLFSCFQRAKKEVRAHLCYALLYCACHILGYALFVFVTWWALIIVSTGH